MTRSTPASTYDDDFYAWTQEQADLLRRLPGAESVDIAHVAEEIEDMGKRDLREVTSLLEKLVEHLVKIDAVPASRDVPHWRGEAREFQRSARRAFSPGMRQLLDVGEIWSDGAKAAVDRLADVGLARSPPQRSPFALDDLLARAFDLDLALAKLAEDATR